VQLDQTTARIRQLPGGTNNLLAGTGNHASTDAPFGIQNGYIFNAVLNAGGTVRNYGFLVNNIGSISHRGTAFVVGPYVKKGAVIKTRYSQVNALRTIEDILGTEHINLNTAFQVPMDDVFDITSNGQWRTPPKHRRC
jgi:hypothetical protein